ncbi:hypothetical protein GW17_00004353 [Ensete ventricosum]|uniref:Uncharacterized protein n=1 Tax=Ensete ventricosum TaxID=4639 RepID=A0A444G842_ENSVE|nr:hypothetical protein B296_00013528 [Ensete ventricosum]RWW31044.1 hypothetical protein GW17_00004353 [Ensete ventricosum]
MESRKSRLNLPAGMESSLRLDSIPAAHFPAIPKTPSPSKTTYGDRFIPCRSSSRLQNFALAEKPSPTKEGGNDAYSRLLRAELFGHDPAPYSPGAQGSPISPSKNLFRFKTVHSAPSSPFSVTSVAAYDTALEVSTPPKVPRKIAKTPHKVKLRYKQQRGEEIRLILFQKTGRANTVIRSIGTSLGDVQVCSYHRLSPISEYSGDKNILHHDLRVPGDFVSKLVGHRSEVATLTGHTLRVLYLAMSPDGQAPVRDTGVWSLGRTHIR